MSERSSRVRIGTLDSTVSLPPRWSRNVRSETLPISTPSTPCIRSTISSAWSGSRVSIVRSTRIRACPDPVTSSPVTTPPADSMRPESSLTAVGRAGSTRRTVTELAIEGAEGMGTIQPRTAA
jgi:hypothetical protein